MSAQRGAVGSVSARGRPVRAPLRWLPWLLLLLLGLLIAASFLIARNVADEGDQPGVDVENDPSPSGELRDDPATEESGMGRAAPTMTVGAASRA